MPKILFGVPINTNPISDKSDALNSFSPVVRIYEAKAGLYCYHAVRWINPTAIKIC
jgi:hypothetical protein